MNAALSGMAKADVAVATGAHVTDEVDVGAAFREHGAFLARVIRRLLRDGPDVDDVLQETFIVALKRRREFQHRSSVRTWLYSIAANLCLRRQRGQGRLRSFLDRLTHGSTEPAPRPDEALERTQARAQVLAAIERLPFKQREVFVLYELEQLEGRDIAELLGIPLGTVWTRLTDARRRFAEATQQVKKEHAP